MPLASPGTLAAMDTAIQTIVNNLPTTAEGIAAWNAASAWAPVATAFFSSAVVPEVTEVGLLAGETAFISGAQEAMEATNMMTDQALSAGFQAYAEEVVKPLNCLPPTPVVHLQPPNPPWTDLSELAPSETTWPSTQVLYNQLMEWVVLGTQTTPGTPPVTVNWS